MRFSFASLTVALLAAAAVPACILPAAAGTLLVPSQFPTIQKALNAARPYDTVLVSAKPKGGVYNEAVTIATPHVTLQGRNNPVIDGTGLGTPSPNPFQPGTYPNAVEIQAGHVAVRGLVIQNTGNLQGFGFGPGGSGINVGAPSADGLSSVSYGDIEITGVTVRSSVAGITISGLSGANDGTALMLKGYTLSGDTVSGSVASGVRVSDTSGALITGCRFTGSGGDGLDTNGSGIVVSGNEVAANSGYGMALNAPRYNPAKNDPKAPNPAPSTAAFNTVHDNQRFGISVTGTQTITGNVLARNTDYGLYLYFADYSVVSFNSIIGTALAVFFGPDDDGTGLYATSGLSYPEGTPGGFLLITGNSIAGNAGDGLFLGSVVKCTVSLNDVSGNSGVGIHLSDYTATDEGLSAGKAPNTVALNHALRSTLFDARDDASAPDTLTYPNGYTSVGDGITTVNVWTKNQFGTTDPVGLSK